MISRTALRAWVHRPAALAGLSATALVLVVGGGLTVARAVDGAPVADTTASPTATASPTTTATADGATASSSPATGATGGDNSAAVGVNTVDGRTVYAIKLRIIQTSRDTVDASNAAVAINSGCTGCSTVAISFEGVLVAGSPSDFEPTNLALAANIDCSGCTAFADAYQKVVQSSTRVRITGDGRREIARIRQDLNTLRTADLTLAQLRARVAADEQAFAAVLNNDIVPIGHTTGTPAGADISDNPTAASPSGATPTPTATPGASTSPTPSVSPTATGPSPSASNPTPTASASTPDPSPTA